MAESLGNGETEHVAAPLLWQRRVWESDERLYVATLQQNLFGEWVVVRYWAGKLRKGGHTRTEYVRSYIEGCALLDDIGRRRVRRGYCLVEIEG